MARQALEREVAFLERSRRDGRKAVVPRAFLSLILSIVFGKFTPNGDI
jgi:hypothetical protein